MALAIRLSRGGRKARPFYRIVVADKRMPRDGRYIEKLGTYNPLLTDENDQRVVMDTDRVKHWLSQGAQPSERVAIFLGKAGLIDMPKQSVRPKKSEPSEATKLRVAEKAEKKKAAEEAAKAAEEEAKAAAEAAKAEAEAAAAAPAEETAGGDTDNPQSPAEVPAEQPAEVPADAPAEKPAE